MIQILAAFILVAAGHAEDSCPDGSCASSRQLLQRNSESSDTVLLGDEEWGSSAGSCTTAGSAGVGAGHPCIFPFTYKRNNYSACTTVDHSTPWCSTQVDGNQEFVLAKWGECSSSCSGTTTTTTIITSSSAAVQAGSSQIPVTSAVGIKVGDLITLDKASLLQAQAEKWEWADIFGSGAGSQKPAIYVVQSVTLGSDGVSGIVVLDRKLEQDVVVGAKIVVSPPPPTTTTTTAFVPTTTTTPAPTTTTSTTTTTTPAPTTTTSTTATTPAPTTTTSTTTTTPAPTTTTSTTTTTPAPTTTTSTTTTTPAPTTTTSTTTTTPAPTTTTSTTITIPAPTTVPTTTEVTTSVMSTTTEATTVTTTKKRWAIIPVVVNASKTPKFKLKVIIKK